MSIVGHLELNVSQSYLSWTMRRGRVVIFAGCRDGRKAISVCPTGFGIRSFDALGRGLDPNPTKWIGGK